jgi:hypothetical protein
MRLTEDLAYLLGSLRDGSLAKSGNLSEVTLASDYHEDWIREVIVPKAARELGVHPDKIRIYKIWTHKSQRPFYRAKIYSVRVRKVFSEFYNPGNQKYWETPEAIKNSNIEIQRAYIRGFFDAEGGSRDVSAFKKGKTKTINCEISIRCKHSKSPNEPLEFIKTFLETLGMSVHLRKDETAIVLTGKHNILRFYREIGSMHPRKETKMRDLLQYYKAFDPVEASMA